MSNTRSKAIRGEDVVLSIQYYGTDGMESSADSAPSIEIRDEDGNIIVAETTDGVEESTTGLYEYTYSVDSDSDKGLWADTWTATIDGVELSTDLSFLVTDEVSSEAGTIRIGDDVTFDYSESEIEGINILLYYIKARLRSSGVKPIRDEFGAYQYDSYGNLQTEECNVFSDDILVCFLSQALSEFNMVPFFTAYTFGDDVIKTLFPHAIVEGAYVIALASQALVEKGRDFTISDGGLSYQPPQLGDFLQSHYGTWLSAYRERLKFIKNSIRPGPVGYGTYTNLTSTNPAFTRLRHLRGRRIV